MTESTSTPRHAAVPIVGLNVHTLTDREVREVVSLGIRHVRTTLYTSAWSRYPSYPQSYRELVQRCDDAGIRLTVVVHNWLPPDDPVVERGVDRELMDWFADFVARRAAEMPTVEAWQLWNEQDLWVQAPFGAGRGIDMRDRGRAYGEQLRMATPRIRQANPRAIVVSGGITRVTDAFLDGMLESDPPLDAVAVHIYGRWDSLRGPLRHARTVIGDRQLWLTECGSLRGSDHLATWRSVIEGNDAELLADRLYPYALDGGVETYHTLRGKPTEAWLRDYLRGR